jgi:protein subunit release factor A
MVFAIRITNFPSGIVATCQNEHSQNKNKEVSKKAKGSGETQRGRMKREMVYMLFEKVEIC